MGVPVPWLVGPVAVSLGFSITGKPPSVQPGLHRLAQAAIGVNVAGGFNPEVMQELLKMWPAALATALMTFTLGLVTGLLLARVARVERRTAVLGFVPGGASGIVAVSGGLGADPPAVTVVQYVRMMTALLSAPLLVAAFGHTSSGASEATVPVAPAAANTPAVWAGLGATLASLATGLLLATFIRVPAGPVILPMVIAAGLNGAGLPHQALPPWIANAAMAVLGTWVGTQFRREDVGRYLALSVWAAVLSSGLIGGSMAVGWALYRLTGLPLLVAMLATAPGALESMAAAALATGEQPGIVVTFHVVRMVATLALGPALASRLPAATAAHLHRRAEDGDGGRSQRCARRTPAAR